MPPIRKPDEPAPDIDEEVPDPTRFKDFSAPPAAPDDRRAVGFAINGVDIECHPELTHAAMLAQWRIASARFKGERQQAYADFLDASILPPHLPVFHAALTNPLKPVLPEQVKAIVEHLGAEYMPSRPTPPSS